MIELHIALGLSIAALVLAAAALIRSWVPPQQRTVYELMAQVADLQHAVDTFGGRLTGWKRAEGMEQARGAFKTRRQAQDAILTEAQEVLKAAAKPQPGPGPLHSPAVPLTKEALRAQFGIVR